MTPPSKTLARLAATLALAATSASAAVTLISEDFNYGGSSSALSGSAGGSGFSGNWAAQGTPNGQYNPSNLTVSTTGYVNAASSVGSYSTDGLTANGGVTTNFNLRTISSPDTYLGTAGNTIWFSFLARNGATVAQNNAVLGFSDGTGMFAANQLTTGLSAGNFTLQIGSTAQAITGTATFSANTTYLIVGRFVSGGTGNNDTMNVWFNPTDVSSIASIASTAQASSSATGVNFKGTANNFLDGIQLGVRDAGSSSNISAIDAIRLAYGGTTDENFAYAVTAIPEPSTYAALAAIGALGLAAVRRRRAAC
jgi:hypothetical protein